MNLQRFLDLFRSGREYADPVRNADGAFFEIDAWSVSAFVAERLLPLVGCHPFPLNEQMLMTAAVCRARPTHIMEWGTNIGVSARIFHEICRTFSLAAEIHSIDLPDHAGHAEHPGRERGRLVRGIPGVTLHQGDGCSVALEILARAAAPVRPFFFLDGDHACASVSRELRAISIAWPAASILVHDTFCQSRESGYNTGPWLAIRELLQESGARYERQDQHLGLPGMTLLWPRA